MAGQPNSEVIVVEANKLGLELKLAQDLVDVLLDSGKIPDGKAIDALAATDKSTQSTEALIAKLKAKAGDSSYNSSHNTKSSTEQNAQLAQLLTRVQEYVRAFQTSY